MFFLEARDDVLIRRFSETRHRHPLDTEEGGVAASIARERELLAEIRAEADVIIDTSELSGRQLRERLTSTLSAPSDHEGITLQLVSFGYKHGIPLEADLVFDVRFMENPFYIDRLRPLNGLDRRCARVRPRPAADRALPRLRAPVPGPGPARLQGRGPQPADGRLRLHRRPAPLDRHRRGSAARSGAPRNGPVSVWHRELERS